MVSFALSLTIRDAVKTVMKDKTLDHMIDALTTKPVDLLQGQMVKITAGVQTTASKWSDGKWGCLPLALTNVNLALATGKVLTTNVKLPLPAVIHKDIKDETKQQDLIRLTQE